jgi:outer membrane immunogenic protein
VQQNKGKTMNKTIAAALAVATLSSTALAADLGSGGYKDGPEYPVAGTAVRWTGVYIGVEGGYAFGNANVAGLHDEGIDGAYTFSHDGLSQTGLVGDITIGYDYHIPASRLVVGVFGDYVFGKADGSTSFSDNTANCGYSSGCVGNVGFSIDNQWKLGGRIGVIVAPGTMAYTKVGWSQADLNVSHSFNHGIALGSVDVSVESAYSSPTMGGLLIGAGFESNVVGGLFLRGEYNYVNFGENTVYNHTSVNTDGKLVAHDSMTTDIDEHLVKVGLVYKLGFDGNVNSFK